MLTPGQRRSQPARLHARRQHDRSVHPGRGGGPRLQRAEHLQLPAARHRLQLLRRLAARCPRHALVDAGNALDVASLGVALMRASGIPAQYVEGTLSESPGPDAASCRCSRPATRRSATSRPARQSSDPARRSTQLLSGDGKPLLVRVQHRQRLGERRPADGRGRRTRSARRSRRHGHVYRGAAEPAANDRGVAYRGDLQPGGSGLRARSSPFRTRSSWIRRSTTWIWWAGR